jgi:hypothetical protein
VQAIETEAPGLDDVVPTLRAAIATYYCVKTLARRVSGTAIVARR